MEIVNDKKRVLFVITQSEMGGAQRFVFETATRLNPEKYEISVAAGGKGGLLEKLSKLEIKTEKLTYLERTPSPFQIISGTKEIYNLLKREKPDVLFLCSTTAGLLGSVASFFYKKSKIIYRIGGWSFRDPRPWWQNRILIWLERITSNFKDKIIVNSEIDRQIAIDYKICPSEKIVKIYNGIDADSLAFLSKEEARKALLIAPGSVVGTVANFYKTKGLTYLIEAVRLLNAKYSTLNTKFLIIGEGKQRKELESLIKKYGLESQVSLLGRIPDAYKYLKAFDVFVLASLKEGFPWIILETMAAKVPIISTDVGAIPEIIEDEKEGILIEPKNSEVLSEKIRWLINHLEEANGFAEKAKEKLQKFNLEKMIEETEKIVQG